MINWLIKNRINKALIEQENEIKEALLWQLDEMQRNYEVHVTVQ